MRLGGSTTDPEAIASLEIDAQIAKDRKVMDREIRILCMGAGDSGKDEVLSHWKVSTAHDGVPDEEAERIKPVLQRYVVECIHVLVHWAHRCGLELQDSSKVFAANLGKQLTPQLGAEIAHLWKDPAIQKTFEWRPSQLNHDTTKYVLDDVERIAAVDYLPTPQDVLTTYRTFRPIREFWTPVDHFTLHMIDVEWMRSERKKWIHMLQDVSVIAFFVNMDCYHVRLFDDEHVNLMHEHLHVFDYICNSRWFQNTGLILILTMVDAFKERIRTVDLNVCFSDYTGGADYDAAASFVEAKFKSLNRQPNRTIHIVIGSDVEAVPQIFTKARLEVLRY